MPLDNLEGQPQEISAQDALNAAWAKVGQLTFQIDIMTQQLRAFEAENKKLKEQLEEKKPKGKK